MSTEQPDGQQEMIPRAVRSWGYVVGVLCGAVATAITTEAPLAARILAAVATAALAVAVGYRPTR